MSGITHGFHIIDTTDIRHSVDMDNYSWATNINMRTQTEPQVKAEIDNGHYLIVTTMIAAGHQALR